MKARRVVLKALYESTDISQSLAMFMKSFSVSENLGGEADSADITLQDKPDLWMGDWLPERGATVDITLQVNDWTGEGDTRELPFGKFEIDTITNSGPPNEAKLKLISIPNNSAIRAVEKTRSWEKAKLSVIAADVAKDAGLELFYDTEEDPELERAEQSEQTDLAFLQKLCKDAGLSLKVTDEKIIIFDVKKYEQEEPVMTLTRGENVLSYSCEMTIREIYKACHVKYKHSKKSEYIEATYTAPGREDSEGLTLQVNEKVETQAEAEKLAKKKLREKNEEEVKASITTAGNFALLASNTVMLKGFHSYDGKYIITRSSHDVSGGYTTKVDLRRVLDGY